MVVIVDAKWKEIEENLCRLNFKAEKKKDINQTHDFI